MKTTQTNSIHSSALVKLSLEPTVYTNNQWDSPFIKKFVTTKWPFELYKGSIFDAFWSVLSS